MGIKKTKEISLKILPGCLFHKNWKTEMEASSPVRKGLVLRKSSFSED